MQEKKQQEEKKDTSDDSKIAALHENFSHLRYVMGARLWFTNIHAMVIAFLFRHFLEGDLIAIIFGYLITLIGVIYVIRESNASDNYMEKISILAKELRLRKPMSEQDYLAIHLDKELPESFIWKYVFRIRTAFVLYYSSMVAILTEFLLRKIEIDLLLKYPYSIVLHILIDLIILVIFFSLLYYFSETFKRDRKENKEEQVYEI